MPALTANPHAHEGERPENAAALRRPYRPVPRDFVEKWPKIGWGGAKEAWRAHSRTIERWVDECGRDRMILARKAYLEAQRAVAMRAKRKGYALPREGR